MEDSKELTEFSSAWWCHGRHSQTIWRRVFGKTPTVNIQRERWKTPDDDFLDLDFTETNHPKTENIKTPTILLLHGLEGSSRAKYVLGMLKWVTQLGWRGVALNFRSCSGEINRQKRFYHSGETTDLKWVVGQLIKRFPNSPFFLIGFSLGGNVLIKWLGEEGKKVPPQVQGATAISVPFDLAVAARRIDQGFNRIYGSVFLKTLREKTLAKERKYPGLVDPKQVSKIFSFAQFDNEVTAPIHGFKDGKDYWVSSSSMGFLGEVQVPTLLISAQDDPFLPTSYLPRKVIEQSKWLTGCFPSKGGHVGFVEGRSPWGVSYWSESKTFSFISDFV